MNITSKQLSDFLGVDSSTIRQWKVRSKLIFDSDKTINLDIPDNIEFISDRCLKNGINIDNIFNIEPEQKKETQKQKKSTVKKVVKRPPKPKEAKIVTEPKKEIVQEVKPEPPKQIELDFEAEEEPKPKVPETLSQKKLRAEIQVKKLEAEKRKLELEKVKGNLIDVASSNAILNRAITGLMSNVRDSVKQSIQSKLSDVDSDRLMELFKEIESEMNTSLNDTIESMINDSDLIVKELSYTVGRGQQKIATR